MTSSPPVKLLRDPCDPSPSRKRERTTWLQGPPERCTVLPEHVGSPWRHLYHGLGLLVPGDATGSPDEIYARIMRTLNARAQNRLAIVVENHSSLLTQLMGSA